MVNLQSFSFFLQIINNFLIIRSSHTSYHYEFGIFRHLFGIQTLLPNSKLQHMIFFRPELGKANNVVFPRIGVEIYTTSFHETLSVTWWVESVNIGAFVPQSITMTSCPARVGTYFISKIPTQFIEENENTIVYQFDLFLEGTNIFVIKLLSAITYRLDHVRANDRVMCI